MSMNNDNLKTELAKEVRSLIEFELTRLDDRIKTLFTVQGLMFVALGFAWDKSAALSICLTLAGMITIATLGAIAQASVNAIRTLESQHPQTKAHEIDDGSTSPWTSVQHSRMRMLGRHPIFWIGFSSGMIWSGILLAQAFELMKG